MAETRQLQKKLWGQLDHPIITLPFLLQVLFKQYRVCQEHILK